MTVFRIPWIFLVAWLVLCGGCTKAVLYTSGTIHGRTVIEADLPELTKVIESCRNRLELWNDDVPRDAITITVIHPKTGERRYYYSPARKSVLWVDDVRGRKFGCSVSGHFSMTIEECFKNAE